MMKKAMSSLLYLLFILTSIFPVGALISACFGYDFVVIWPLAFAAIIVSLSICGVAFEFVFKNNIEHKGTQIILSLITPLILMNAVLYMFEYDQIWAVICLLVSAGCCVFLTVKYGKPLAFKILVLGLSAVIALPLGFVSFFTFIFGSVGQNTVVQTVESSNGKYYAQVIDSDQGALGGATLVNVYEKHGMNIALFRIQEKPQRVYFGDWGEFETMQIYWKDDECLVINCVEYEIEE